MFRVVVTQPIMVNMMSKLKDSKIWKYLWIPLLIICVSYLIRDIFSDYSAKDKKITKLENGIEHRNRLLNGQMADIRELELQLKRTRGREHKALKELDELDIEFEKLKNRKPKIKTIYINKIEYVPLEEYNILYNFTKELRENFSLYITANKDSDLETDKIIAGFEKIVEGQNETISDQEKIIKILKRKSRKWGLYIGYGVNVMGEFSLNLSIGYRIL